jgi:hypothetical protein
MLKASKITPYSIARQEKLVRKFLAFYGTQRLIILFTTACHLFLS